MTRPPHQVQCWHVRLPAVLRPQDQRLLDPAEQARAAAMTDPARRIQYVAAHAALRRVLGAATDQAPEAVQFHHEAHGRPLLRGDNAPHFSLSHSGPEAAIALSHSVRLGVDLELRRPRPQARRLVQRLFAPAERDLLLDLPTADFDIAFARLWVLKEAFIKADGRGLAYPLHSFAIDPREPRLLHCDLGFPSGAQLSYKELCKDIDSALVVCSTHAVEIEHLTLDMRVDIGRAA